MDLSQKKVIEIVCILLGIGLVVWAFVSYDKEEVIKKEETKKITSPTVTQSAPNQSVESFPDNIPLNGMSAIKQSYSATYPNSTVLQSTVIFTSSKNAKENFDFYKKWALDNAWQVINSSQKDNLSSLYLRKGNEDIKITITANNITISYVKK